VTTLLVSLVLVVLKRPHTLPVPAYPLTLSPNLPSQSQSQPTLPVPTYPPNPNLSSQPQPTLSVPTYPLTPSLPPNLTCSVECSVVCPVNYQYSIIIYEYTITKSKVEFGY